MYLTADEWREIGLKPKKVNFSEPYLLEYFLSDVSEQHNNNIQKIADNLHLKRYRLWDTSVKDLFVTGPDEFLYLIDHAALVCTDSYHATIFSILFERPFIVYPRGHMNSRIDTLLQTFGFEDRKSTIVSSDIILKMSFTKCEKELELRRKEYKLYIQSIIGNNNC